MYQDHFLAPRMLLIAFILLSLSTLRFSLWTLRTHSLHTFLSLALVVLWILWPLAAVATFGVWWRLKRRIRGLAGIFDPGTAILGDDFIFGRFRGRSAWVSLGWNPRRIQIGINGRFTLPFVVHAVQSRWSVIARFYLDTAVLGPFFFVTMLPRAVQTFPHFTIGSYLVLGVCAFPLVLMLLFDPRRRRPPFFITRFEIQLAATRLMPFETWEPDRLRLGLDRPEVRESLAHIFDFFHADGMKSLGGRILPWRAGLNGEQSSLETYWLFPLNILDVSPVSEDRVAEVLAELSKLCAAAEQSTVKAA